MFMMIIIVPTSSSTLSASSSHTTRGSKSQGSSLPTSTLQTTSVDLTVGGNLDKSKKAKPFVDGALVNPLSEA